MIQCPKCGNPDSRIKETKPRRVDDAIVRYRTCLACFHDFPTHERVVTYVGTGKSAVAVELGGDE